METIEIELKEKSYYFLRVLISLLAYGGLVTWVYLDPDALTVVVSIIVFFAFLTMMRNGIMVGVIKAHAVKLGKNQMPEIYQIVEDYSERMHLNQVPQIYLMEMGGLLNAFATRLYRSNYIVLYSELAEGFYAGNADAIKFVIAHELGDIKRKHLVKEFFVAPSGIIPFLTLAYQRACERTCDNFGKHFSPNGAVQGILTLAAGPELRTKINPKTFIEQVDTDAGFWRWLVEKLSSHPNLNKRLQRVYDERTVKTGSKPEPETVKKEIDHSQYMPK